VTFSQKSDVKKHLAQGLKKTHYLNPTHPNNPAEKVDEEPAATDSTSTLIDAKGPLLVSKRP
jgi:hypothetical protein